MIVLQAILGASIAMLWSPMAPRFLSLAIDFLFGLSVFIVVTGGFDFQGSIAGRSVRLDATSPDLVVALFLILLGVWRLTGRAVRELHCVRLWESIYEKTRAATSKRLWAALGAITVLMVAVPLVRHQSLRTGIDLALFGQAYWNTLQGDFLFSSIQGGIALWGEHFNPIVLGILPFYWLWPSPETLLVLQSLALVAGAVPLYALARRELEDQGAAILITLAYLLYLPLRQSNLFDFHPVVFATPLILSAFYFLRRGTVGRFLVCCLLVGLTKETGPIAVGLLGAACFYLSPRKWLGAGLIVVSTVWFFFNLAVVIPAFNPSGVETQLDRYHYLGDSPGEMLRTLVTRPGYVLSQNLSSRELFYPVRILAPVVFLPLLTPVGLLMVPYLVINLLEASGIQVWLVHYQAELTAFVFVATVFGAKRVLRTRSPIALAAVLTCSCLLFFGTSDVYQLREAWPTAETRRIHEILGRLPAQGRVSAQAALAPHLTQRKWLYVFPEVAEAEWVIVDPALDPWPVRPKRFKRTVRRLGSVGFEREFEEAGTMILRRDERSIQSRARQDE